MYGVYVYMCMSVSCFNKTYKILQRIIFLFHNYVRLINSLFMKLEVRLILDEKDKFEKLSRFNGSQIINEINMGVTSSSFNLL